MFLLRKRICWFLSTGRSLGFSCYFTPSSVSMSSSSWGDCCLLFFSFLRMGMFMPIWSWLRSKFICKCSWFGPFPGAMSLSMCEKGCGRQGKNIAVIFFILNEELFQAQFFFLELWVESFWLDGDRWFLPSEKLEKNLESSQHFEKLVCSGWDEEGLSRLCFLWSGPYQFQQIEDGDAFCIGLVSNCLIACEVAFRDHLVLSRDIIASSSSLRNFLARVFTYYYLWRSSL